MNQSDDPRPARNLHSGMSTRQVTMLSIAGIIGAGLFIGSANAIATAGPAVLLSYLMTGALVLLVMRMLGEMAMAHPDSGSFSTYAERAIGPWAGFSIGWLYWWFWVLIIPVEAIAGAMILHTWFPAVPDWGFAVMITLLLTISNLLSVKNFGEFEFWFALIKVVAIIAFILVGFLAVFGAWPLAQVSGVERLFSVGGFMPNGFGTVLGGILVTIFSFFGAEIVTIAAAEAKNPKHQIRRATNLVVYRIAIFYLLSIFLVVSLVPWNDPRLTEVGTFQRALEILNVPAAKLIIDIVVLVAVTSCMNSGLYTASRMIFSLAKRGEAPRAFARVSQAGVPRRAVLVSTLAGFAGCIANYLFPGEVFSFLLSTTGAIALIVYLVIAVSQLRMRRRLEAQGIEPALKMWLFPWLTWATIGMIVLVLCYMATSPQYRFETMMTALVTGVVLLLSLTTRRPRSVQRLT